MTVVAGIEGAGSVMPVTIRSSVLVNLAWDPNLLIWVVDSSDLDGKPLDTPSDRMSSSDGPYSQLSTADQDRWDTAEEAPVPTAHHLATMILAASNHHHEHGSTYRQYLT